MWHQKSFVVVLTHCTFIYYLRKAIVLISYYVSLLFSWSRAKENVELFALKPLSVTGAQFLFTFTTESNTEVMRVLEITTH